MTCILKRKSNSDHVVKWNPEQTEKAKQAAQEEGIEIGATVDNDTAEAIRQRYEELTTT